MPDMSGWSQRDVIKFSGLVGLNVSYKGTGFVVKQSIKPGKLLSRNQRLLIKLK